MEKKELSGIALPSPTAMIGMVSERWNQKKKTEATVEVDAAYRAKVLNPEETYRKVSNAEAKALWLEIANSHTQRTKQMDYMFTDELKEVAAKLFEIFTDPENKKGVWLMGNVGSGKSSILEIFRQWIFKISNLEHNRYRMANTHEMVSRYDMEGEETLTMYNKGNWFFDDLGTEETAKYYGKSVDIMRPVLEKRYLAFIQNGYKTHITTNLPLDKITAPEDIKRRYGSRVESRIYEMFHLITLGKRESLDFRRM